MLALRATADSMAVGDVLIGATGGEGRGGGCEGGGGRTFGTTETLAVLLGGGGGMILDRPEFLGLLANESLGLGL